MPATLLRRALNRSDTTPAPVICDGGGFTPESLMVKPADDRLRFRRDTDDITPGTKLVAVLLHMSNPLIWLIVAAFATPIAPLFAWALSRSRNRFIRENAASALNASVVICIGAVAAFTLKWLIFGYFVEFAIVGYVVFTSLRATYTALRGRVYRYPWATDFLR